MIKSSFFPLISSAETQQFSQAATYELVTELREALIDKRDPDEV